MNSRIIKFRAYDPEHKTLVVGEKELFDDMLGFRFEHFDCDVEAVVFQQFTGICDSKGNDIYEGDIVKITRWKDTEDESSIVGTVYFEKGSFAVENGCAIGHAGNLLGQFRPEIIEIVGQFHGTAS